MHKFNVNDKVRYLTKGFYGHIGTVVGISEGGLIKVDTHGEYGVCYENASDLEHVGPIRTVTRREIVPGVYGNLDISSFSRSKVFVGLKTECGNRYVYMNATELREAAHVLNQLAEVLEDE